MARIIPFSYLSVPQLLEKAEIYEELETFWEIQHHQAIRKRLTAEARYTDVAEHKLKLAEHLYALVINLLYDVRKELAQRGITTITEG